VSLCSSVQTLPLAEHRKAIAEVVDGVVADHGIEGSVWKRQRLVGIEEVAFAGIEMLDRDGDDLEVHYRHILESLGRQSGTLGTIFRKARGNAVVIAVGIIRVYLTAEDGREATINLLEDGEVIGEMSLLDGLQRSAGAAALTTTKLIFIPREPFMQLLDTSTRLARQIILMLCERLRAADAQVDQAIFHDLRHRLVVLLRQIAVLHGRVEKDMSIVDLDITQGNLAQMLGASREAVNKQLRALAKEGRIVIDGPRIQIFRSTQKPDVRGQMTDDHR
jgi:CRP-like cAMP-binding protein